MKTDKKSRRANPTVPAVLRRRELEESVARAKAERDDAKKALAVANARASRDAEMLRNERAEVEKLRGEVRELRLRVEADRAELRVAVVEMCGRMVKAVGGEHIALSPSPEVGALREALSSIVFETAHGKNASVERIGITARQALLLDRSRVTPVDMKGRDVRVGDEILLSSMANLWTRIEGFSRRKVMGVEEIVADHAYGNAVVRMLETRAP